jgi:cytochrome P450
VADLDYGGVHLTRGMQVAVCMIPAQRDPRVHDNSDTFDITADGRAPILQFGGGPHFCIGAALARVEMAEALTALTARLGPPTIAGPVDWRPPLAISGPYTLPLRFG